MKFARVAFSIDIDFMVNHPTLIFELSQQRSAFAAGLSYLSISSW